MLILFFFFYVLNVDYIIFPRGNMERKYLEHQVSSETKEKKSLPGVQTFPSFPLHTHLEFAKIRSA